MSVRSSSISPAIARRAASYGWRYAFVAGQQIAALAGLCVLHQRQDSATAATRCRVMRCTAAFAVPRCAPNHAVTAITPSSNRKPIASGTTTERHSRNRKKGISPRSPSHTLPRMYQTGSMRPPISAVSAVKLKLCSGSWRSTPAAQPCAPPRQCRRRPAAQGARRPPRPSRGSPAPFPTDG